MHRIYQNKHNLSILLFIIILTLAFYALTYLMPQNTDDFVYKFFFTKQGYDLQHPITNITDIVVSQANHYYCMNGRSIIHFFVQLFCGILGKDLFNLINTIVFVFFITAILYYCNALKKNLFFNTTLTTASILLLLPSFGGTFLWMTGSINYLWPATAVIFFLKMIDNEKERHFRPVTIIFAVFAFFMGWSHEGLTFPLTISLVLYCIIERENISQSFLLIAICFVIGTLICTFSPGIMARASKHSITISDLLFKLINSLLFLFKIPIVDALILLLILQKRLVREWSMKNWLKENIIFVGSSIFSFGVLIAGGAYGRSAFFLSFFCLLLFLKIVFIFPISEMVRRRGSIGIVLAIIITLSLVFPYSIRNYKEYKSLVSQMKARKTIIKSHDTHIPTLISKYFRKILRNNDQEVRKEFDVIDLYSDDAIVLGAVFHTKPFLFLPDRMVNKIEADTNAYKRFENDKHLPYYVIQANSPQINRVTYLLRKTTKDDIPFYYRPFANKMARYTETSIVVSPNLYKLVCVYGRYYLLVAYNNVIDNRIINIKVE